MLTTFWNGHHGAELAYHTTTRTPTLHRSLLEQFHDSYGLPEARIWHRWFSETHSGQIHRSLSTDANNPIQRKRVHNQMHNCTRNFSSRYANLHGHSQQVNGTRMSMNYGHTLRRATFRATHVHRVWSWLIFKLQLMTRMKLIRARGTSVRRNKLSWNARRILILLHTVDVRGRIQDEPTNEKLHALDAMPHKRRKWSTSK